MIWPTCSLVNLTDVYVGLVPGIHLIREKYTSVELRQKAIDDLGLKEKQYWWSKINMVIEYQKAINLFNDTPNQPAKFRTKNWV